MDSLEAKKYIHMENVLKEINRQYITLPQDDVKRNNKILEQVVDPLTEKIKEICPLFKHLYERKFYGGSYYDGLKIDKPEEYDLDYLLNLPLLIESEVQISDRDGYVHVHVNEFMKLIKQKKELSKFEKIEELLIENFTCLSTTKVLVWMEKNINLALNTYPKSSEGYDFLIKLNDEQEIIVHATLSKAHPAFTLKIRNMDENINLDVDLVPCFQFTEDHWPKGKYRKNPTKKNKFLVVPKKPHDTNTKEPIEKYWRLSFQEQERELMKGNNFKAMKPSLKLLKKLRDKYNHSKIASYFIKTVFLWELEKKEEKFWSQPLSTVFMAMLQKYADMVKDEKIPYYWNQNFNMIGHIKEATIVGIGNNLQNIVAEIHSKLEDPFIVGKFLIQPPDLEKLRSEVVVSKKSIKKQHNLGMDLSFENSGDSFRSISNGSESSFDVVDGPISAIKGRPCDVRSIGYVIPPNLDEDTENKILNSLRDLNSKVDSIVDNLNHLTEICSNLASRIDVIEERLKEKPQGASVATRTSCLLGLPGDRLIDTVNFISNLP